VSGFFTNPNQPTTAVYVEVMTAAAVTLGLTLQTFGARNLDEIGPAFEAMVRAGMQAMTAVQGGTAFQGRHIIPKMAVAHGLPMCAFSKETFEPGALISHGPDQVDMCQHSAVHADTILKGAKPTDLPVEQPTKFELLVNLKTAAALGINVPLQLQQLACEVVE